MFKRSSVVFGSIALMFLSVPGAAQASTGQFWQCAPFARLFSGIQLFGNAATWWHEALGHYDRGAAPKVGSVLVFKAIASMRAGHVATVSQIVSDRIIKVTHANWSTPGQVERDVEVVDTSANNDWSRVRVWFKGLHDVGRREYPVFGFIYGGRPGATDVAATDAPTTAAAQQG